jgi:hypothetical protein
VINIAAALLAACFTAIAVMIRRHPHDDPSTWNWQAQPHPEGPLMTHVRKHGRTVNGKHVSVRDHERDTTPARPRPLPAPVIHGQDHDNWDDVMVIDTDPPPGEYANLGREVVDDAYRSIGLDPDDIRALPPGNPLRDKYDAAVARNNPNFYIDRVRSARGSAIGSSGSPL